MYILSGSVFLICILFFVLFQYKRYQAIRKVCEMDECQKLCLLNELAMPFGFSYLPCLDIMTSNIDAWQREFGYQALFDFSAPHFNMVFDCEPIYFEYAGRTWLIEFWKGQYGLSTGAEIGVYSADSALSPSQYRAAHFHSAANEEMLPLSMELYHKNQRMFSINRIHWWLTGFCVGTYTRSEDLLLRISITFPSIPMLDSFIEGLLKMGYEKCNLFIRNKTVALDFQSSHTACYLPRFSLRSILAKCLNKILCRLFCLVTRPFTCTPDRLLYLYNFLPFSFRHIMYFYKNTIQKKRRPNCRKAFEKEAQL